MMDKKIEINYGLLAEKIEKQANDQGFTLGKKSEVYQKDLDCVHRLYARDLLSESQFHQILKKLNKKIIGFLVELE